MALFLLLVAVVVGIGVLSAVVSGVTTFVVSAAYGEAVGTLVSGVVVLPLSILVLGILAEAFTQLRAGQEPVGR